MSAPNSQKYMTMSLDDIITERKRKAFRGGRGVRGFRGGGRGRGRGTMRGSSRGGMFSRGRGMGFKRFGFRTMSRGYNRGFRRGFNNRGFRGSNFRSRGFRSRGRGFMFRSLMSSPRSLMSQSQSHLPLTGLSRSMLNRIGMPLSPGQGGYSGLTGYRTRQIALQRIQKAREFLQYRQRTGRLQAINTRRGIGFETASSINGSVISQARSLSNLRSDHLLRQRRLQLMQRRAGTPARDDDDMRSIVSNKSYQIEIQNEMALRRNRHMSGSASVLSLTPRSGASNRPVYSATQLNRQLQKEIAAIQGRTIAQSMNVGSGEGIDDDFRPTPTTTVCTLSERFGATYNV